MAEVVREPRGAMEIRLDPTDINLQKPIVAPITVREVANPTISNPAGNFDVGSFKPLVDGLQAGSWAIVLLLFAGVYTFRSRFERVMDGLITSIEQVRQNAEDNREYQQFINKQTKRLLTLKKIELEKMGLISERLDAIEAILRALAAKNPN